MMFFSKKSADPEVTLHIEKITNPVARELDWATAFLLCNSVNSTKMGAKDARKILQKKMMVPNPQTQVLALEALNCLAENCGAKFKDQLFTKSFGEDLYTLASSQTLDDKVHGKVVQSLKNWIDHFGSDPASGAVRKAYDVMVNRLVLPDIGRINQPHKPFLRTPTTGQPRKPGNIHDDVAIVKNCAEILSQMLKLIDPLSEDEFYENGKQKQQSLATYLASCEDPDVICTLIEANNKILSCFEVYDDIIEQRSMFLAVTNYGELNDCSTVDINQQQQQPKPESTNSSS
ncbi:hypothetical protein K501DRAFT_271546 [Backusella circina FSU 941]|nr:hypothetical protein K501DRAFT_271546 [Backusella circina FSU 941]